MSWFKKKVGRFFFFVEFVCLWRTAEQAWIAWTYLLCNDATFEQRLYSVYKILNYDHGNVFPYLLFVGWAAVLEESKMLKKKKNCTTRWTPEALNLIWNVLARRHFKDILSTCYLTSSQRNRTKYMCLSKYIYTYMYMDRKSEIQIHRNRSKSLLRSFFSLPVLHHWP